MSSRRRGLRLSIVLTIALALGTAPTLSEPRIARAGSIGQPSVQGAPAPQTPGLYALNLATGRVVIAAPLAQPGLPVEEAWSPDSTKLAIATAADAHAGHGGLQIVEVSTGSVTSVAASNQGRASDVNWSPDGTQLAFIFQGQVGHLGSAGSSLQLWRSRDNTIQNLVPSGARLAAWTADGSGITTVIVPASRDAAGPGARIVTVDARTGDETQTILMARSAECQIGLAWSPDGRYLAYGGHGFHEGCLDGVSLGLWTWDAATGTTRHLLDGTSSAPRWMADGTVLAEVALVGGPTGLLTISLTSFAPDGSGQRVLASPIPNMFPPPNPLFQTANGAAMYAVMGCDGAAAWAIGPDTPQPRNVTSPTTNAFGAHLSPDGGTIAFSGEGSKGAYLALAPVEGGRVTTPLIGGSTLLPGDFSPDGSWLAFSVLSDWPFFCLGG